MRRVRFKSYMGLSKYGKPSFYDCSNYDETDLLAMLRAPLHLTKVNFQMAHQIYGDQLSFLFDQDDGGRLAALWGNQGFVNCLAELGYRCVPDESEIEIFK